MRKLLLSALVVFAAATPINLDSQNTTVYLNKDSQLYATQEITSYDGDSELATVDANALSPASMTDLLLVQEKTYKLKTGDKTLNAIVDMTDPEVNIEGVEDGKSYKKATIKLSVSDKYLSTYKATLNDSEISKKIQYKATKDIAAIPNVGDVEKGQLITLSSEQLDNETVRDLLLDGSLKQIESYDDIEVTEQGKYTLVVTASDSAGNEVKKTVKFNINDKAPTITVTGIDEKVQNEEFILKATINSFLDEEHEIKLTKNGIPIEQDVLKGMKITEDGKYKLEITVTDSAGNTAECTEEFELDTEAPLINIEGTPSDYTNKDVTYTITTDNEEDEFIVKVNDELVEFEGKKCEKTISTEGEYKILVIANDAAGNYSNATSEFIIDKTAPTVECNKKDGAQLQDLRTIVGSGDDKYYDSISITAVCNETSKAITNSSNEKTVSLNKDGEEEAENENWHILITVYDKAENETNLSFDIKRDNVSPEVQIMPLKVDSQEAPLIEDGGKTNTKVNITSNITDANLANIKYSITKDGEKIYSKEGKDQIDYMVSNDGLYKVTATATDAAGNTKTSAQNFTIDTVAPIVTHNAPNKCVKSLNALKFSADEKAVINLDVFRNNIKLRDIDEESLPYSLTGFNNDGVYTITGYAVDEAKNCSSSVNISFVIDTVAPEVSIEGIDNNSFTNKDVTIKATVEELNYKTNTAKLTVNGQDYEIENKGEVSEISKTFTEEGEYEVTISSTDEAGNVAKSKTLKFTIDKTKPVVTVNPPQKNVKVLNSLAFASSEISTIDLEVKLDGEVIKNIKEENLPYSLTGFNKDGDYTITGYATDRAGNKSELIGAQLTIDSTASILVISGIDDGSYSNKDVTITAIVKERNYKTNTAVLTCNGSQTAVQNTSENSTISQTYSSDGVYKVTISATDEAGNVAIDRTLNFTIDKTAPEVTISKPTSTKYSDTISPVVTISDTNYDKNDISLNKGEGISFSDNFGKTGGTRTYNNFKKTKSNDGSYTLTAIAYDKAGNSTKKTETFTVNRFGSTFKTVKVPTTFGKSGEVVIDETNVSNLVSSKVEVSKDAERKETTNYTKSKSGNTTTYTINKNNFTEDGVYKVYITSKDANDNESRSKGDFSFTVDNTDPVISYKGIDAGETYKATTVKLYISAIDTISDDIEYEVTQNGESLKVQNDKDEKFVYLKSGYNQDITIKATDQAGNTATETIEKVTISTSKLAFFYTHKLLTAGMIIGFIGIITLIVVNTKGKKKNDEIGKRAKKSV